MRTGIQTLLFLSLGTAIEAQDTAGVAGCYRFDRAYFSWVGRRPHESAVARDSGRVLRLTREFGGNHVFVRRRVMNVMPVPFATDSFTSRRWLQPSYWEFADARTVNIAWGN